jgi:hypothetical protein
VSAGANARKADFLVPSLGVTAPDGRFDGVDRDAGRWQNMSIRVPKSVILDALRLVAEVTILPKAAENARVLPGRTSDFGHLGLWPTECDSTCELVIQPKQSNGDEETKCGNKRASHLSNC